MALIPPIELAKALVKKDRPRLKFLVDKYSNEYNRIEVLNFILALVTIFDDLGLATYIIGLGANDYNRGLVRAACVDRFDFIKFYLTMGADDVENAKNTALDQGHILIYKFLSNYNVGNS